MFAYIYPVVLEPILTLLERLLEPLSELTSRVVPRHAMANDGMLVLIHFRLDTLGYSRISGHLLWVFELREVER